MEFSRQEYWSGLLFPSLGKWSSSLVNCVSEMPFLAASFLSFCFPTVTASLDFLAFSSAPTVHPLQLFSWKDHYDFASPSLRVGK